jgi:hypothetical protein
MHGYNRPMAKFYGIGDANDLLPDLTAVVGRLREQRAELVELRDAFRDHAKEGSDAEVAADRDPGGATATDDPELRRIRLRMSGIVDQMAADVAWLDERGIVLRDIPTGLLDFPALAAGRQVWLCWRLGEDRVDWWHAMDEGFAGRQPMAMLPGEVGRA